MLCVSKNCIAFAGLATRTGQIKPDLHVMSKKRGGLHVRAGEMDSGDVRGEKMACSVKPPAGLPDW